MYDNYLLVASQYVTASGVTLLIRQNTEQGDTYDEIALKEYSMDALKAIISGKFVVHELCCVMHGTL